MTLVVHDITCCCALYCQDFELFSLHAIQNSVPRWLLIRKSKISPILRYFYIVFPFLFRNLAIPCSIYIFFSDKFLNNFHTVVSVCSICLVIYQTFWCFSCIHVNHDKGSTKSQINVNNLKHEIIPWKTHFSISLTSLSFKIDVFFFFTLTIN